MSVSLMAAVWAMELPSTEKMVLLCLCDHANNEGNCWPSMERIAGRCGVAERTVRRAIKSLVAKGALSAQLRQGTSNLFHVNPGHCVTPDTVSPRTLCHPGH